MFAKKIKGFSLVEILVVIGIIGLILTFLVVALNLKQQSIRDTKRVSDIQTLRNALEVMKNETGGYDQSLCGLTFVRACGQQENSALIKIMPGIKSLADPKFQNLSCANATACQGGGCDYGFTKIEPADYEVRFYLERGVDDYQFPGCYRASPQGIFKL